MSPYLIANVAFADEWLFENGVLCYLRGRELRILDLHHSWKHEIVVDTRRLVFEALKDSHARHKYKLKLLYYSDNIVSCTYTMLRHDQAASKHWLLVFNPLEGQLITARQLDSVSKLFVRNNDSFLYYGTASAPDHEGSGHWVISGFDLKARKPLSGRLEHPTAIGTDVGSTVCFEIFDGHFYCLSNQRSLDVEEVDWLSFYTCFRFPLGSQSIRVVEEPTGQPPWRRDHTEGPIDDRWTFLRMFKDEATGQIQAVESRKEWLSGRISGKRTYYTTPISFATESGKGAERRLLGETDAHISAAKTQPGAAVRPRARDPHLVHPGDDSATLGITLSKCPVRSYNPACQTFIDLVDDSNSFDPAHQRFRIRGGTRRPWGPGERAGRGGLPAAQGPDDQDTLLQRIDDLYKSESGLFWPPEQDPSVADPALAALHGILNPSGFLGSPCGGSWNERSMLYALGGTKGGLKSLTFVSFDPSIYLAGTAAYPGDLALGGQPKPAANRPPRVGNGTGVHIPERHPTLQPKTTHCLGGGVTPETLLGGDRDANPPPWKTVEPAAYLEIKRGYHFAR